jgi:iron(II)-dependent oxidoreductase
VPAIPTDSDLADWVRDARARTLALHEDLDDAAMLGPKLRIVNPPLWEIGHVAWFMEKWILRGVAGRAPLYPDPDQLYDSSAIPHDTRWDLPLPTRARTLEYLADTRDAVLELLAAARPASPELRYFVTLSVFHEDMHDEAFAYTRQTHGHPAPRAALPGALPLPLAALAAGDVTLPGGSFRLGAEPAAHAAGAFVFDNEKWAHEVTVRPFAIAREPVTEGELEAFTDEGGYTRRELWSDDGWAWRVAAAAEHPLYWRRAGAARWERRLYDRFVPVEPARVAAHVNWHEAQAYCRFAGRRLPTEAEFEFAARHAGPKLRHLTDSIWQWTSTPFAPYPGFVADPYADYSQPWFHTHRVLRGGAWCTQRRLLRPTWRNFYTPDRRDVWAGFRTCAVRV